MIEFKIQRKYSSTEYGLDYWGGQVPWVHELGDYYENLIESKRFKKKNQGVPVSLP
jgi:hypothetical protein